MAGEKKISGSESRGERLKKIRKAKGLSLEEVHQGTKIHIKIIKALEDDSVATISPTYVKGLLKIYCNFLGVAPEDFIEKPIHREQVMSLPLDKPQASIPIAKNPIILKSLIFLICLLVLSLAFFKIGKTMSMRRSSNLEKVAPVVTMSRALEVSSPRPVVTKPRLGIRAKEDCLVEVKIDGKTVFKNILRKGHFEHWEAEEKIEFSLGNAGGVEIDVNGKLISALGRRRQVIKNITVTKNGLKVPQ